MALEQNKSYDAAIAKHVVASALQNKVMCQGSFSVNKGEKVSSFFWPNNENV